MRTLLPLLLLLSGCTLTTPSRAVPPTTPSRSWPELLSRPGPLSLESVTSARWVVPRGGLINLDHPAAKAAGLKEGPMPIVLPLHVLRHPTKGVFVIDSGVSRALEAGGPERLGASLRPHVEGLEPVEALGDILARQPGPVAGVLLTHLHFDHLLGLPDVAPGTPLFSGPGEYAAQLRGPYGAPMESLFEGHGKPRELDFAHAPVMPPLGPVIDLLGDGSLYALSMPGHTPGSVAYLARTTEGPVLFTGDTCHTRWGWENGVEPGHFTEDAAGNVRSLEMLRKLAAQVPDLQVFVGHELE